MAANYDPKKADAIIAAALARIGEHEQPPGSNRGPLPDKALAFVGLAPGQAWCAAFACLCVHDAGVTDGPHSGSTGAIAAWGKMRDAATEDPRRGDIGLVKDQFTATGYEHTVLIEHNEGGGVVKTIEGNYHDGVFRNVRRLDTMTYVRPYR